MHNTIAIINFFLLMIQITFTLLFLSLINITLWIWLIHTAIQILCIILFNSFILRLFLLLSTKVFQAADHLVDIGVPITHSLAAHLLIVNFTNWLIVTLWIHHFYLLLVQLESAILYFGFVVLSDALVVLGVALIYFRVLDANLVAEGWCSL